MKVIAAPCAINMLICYYVFKIAMSLSARMADTEKRHLRFPDASGERGGRGDVTP